MANYPSKFVFDPDWSSLGDLLVDAINHDHDLPGVKPGRDLDTLVALLTQRDRQLEDYLANPSTSSVGAALGGGATYPNIDTTSSTGYIQLGGPSFTIIVPAGITSALVTLTANLQVTAGATSTNGPTPCMGFSVGGGTTISPDDAQTIQATITTADPIFQISATFPVTLQGAGSTTFIAQYKMVLPAGVPSGTVQFANRSIAVLLLGS